MFKKKIFTVIMILFSLVLISCSANNDSATNEGYNSSSTVIQKQTQEPSSTENGNTNNQQVTDSSNSTMYDLTKESYNDADKNIEINYLQITNLNDNNKEKIINTLIKNDAFQMLEDYKSGDVDLTVLEIDYEIKLKSEKILSIQYSGYANFKNSAHPYHIFFTTNININNENDIKLIELVNINKDFVELFRSKKFKSVSPIYQTGYLESYSNDELIETFKTAELYLTTDSLGISVDVPYAIGNHA
jgi:hypothetical protein